MYLFYYVALVTNTKDVRLNSYNIDSSNPDVTKYIVFLHGLFGNANNWRYISYSESIRERRNSLLVDLRNHGESDHHGSMTYPEMANDVVHHLKEKGINKFTLLGHSMGAKTAMNIATMYPDMLDGLVIVDSAPKDHSTDEKIFNATKNVIDRLSGYDINGKTRKEAMEDFKNMFVFIVNIVWISC